MAAVSIVVPAGPRVWRIQDVTASRCGRGTEHEGDPNIHVHAPAVRALFSSPVLEIPTNSVVAASFSHLPSVSKASSLKPAMASKIAVGLIFIALQLASFASQGDGRAP